MIYNITAHCVIKNKQMVNLYNFDQMPSLYMRASCIQTESHFETFNISLFVIAQ